MSCRFAVETDEYHGWRCVETDGACMFLNPNEKQCYEKFEEGPLAFENLERSVSSAEDRVQTKEV